MQLNCHVKSPFPTSTYMTKLFIGYDNFMITFLLRTITLHRFLKFLNILSKFNVWHRDLEKKFKHNLDFVSTMKIFMIIFFQKFKKNVRFYTHCILRSAAQAWGFSCCPTPLDCLQICFYFAQQVWVLSHTTNQNQLLPFPAFISTDNFVKIISIKIYGIQLLVLLLEALDRL